jgi:hypothetical protein
MISGKKERPRDLSLDDEINILFYENRVILRLKVDGKSIR